MQDKVQARRRYVLWNMLRWISVQISREARGRDEVPENADDANFNTDTGLWNTYNKYLDAGIVREVLLQPVSAYASETDCVVGF